MDSLEAPAMLENRQREGQFLLVDRAMNNRKYLLMIPVLTTATPEMDLLV